MSTDVAAQRSAAEQRARVLIDEQLVAAGWVVQDKKDLSLFAPQGLRCGSRSWLRATAARTTFFTSTRLRSG